MEDKNRLFQQFDTKKLEDLSADNLDSFRDQVYIEKSNSELVDDLIRYGIINNQISFGGPITRTAKQVSSQVTYSGAATVTQECFKPNPGEVWQYNQASVRMQGGTSGITLMLGDDTTTSTNNVMLGQESSSGVQPFDLVGQMSPLYITSEQYLIAQHYSLTTGEESEVRVSVIRVR